MSNLVDALIFTSTSGLLLLVAYRIYSVMDSEEVKPEQFILKKGSLFFLSIFLTLLSFFAMLSSIDTILIVFMHMVNILMFGITVIFAIIDTAFYIKYVAVAKKSK